MSKDNEQSKGPEPAALALAGAMGLTALAVGLASTGSGGVLLALVCAAAAIGFAVVLVRALLAVLAIRRDTARMADAVEKLAGGAGLKQQPRPAQGPGQTAPAAPPGGYSLD